MTVIGFSVSTMFIVFVCTRLVCARIQLNANRRSFRFASRSDLSMLERGCHGIEPVVVAKFPTKKYSDESFCPTGDSQCTVCLSEYHAEDILRILPYCGHSFHVTCIDIWLHQHSTCPVCRISLRELPERKRLMRPLFSSAARAHYIPGAITRHAINCPLRGHPFPSRTHQGRAVDPVQASHFASEIRAEAGENIFPTPEGNQDRKDSREKHTESQSNT